MIRPPETSIQTLYAELRGIAAHKLRNERSDHTLSATALVNEAFLKLRIDAESVLGKSRAQFLRVVTEAMRQILVDHARAKLAAKRRKGRTELSIEHVPMELPLPSEELIAIHDCLDAFEAEDPIKAQLVKLRIFGGLSHSEAAKELGLSRQTADRYWAYARVRLYTMIGSSEK